MAAWSASGVPWWVLRCTGSRLAPVFLALFPGPLRSSVHMPLSLVAHRLCVIAHWITYRGACWGRGAYPSKSWVPDRPGLRVFGLWGRRVLHTVCVCGDACMLGHCSPQVPTDLALHTHTAQVWGDRGLVSADVEQNTWVVLPP